MFKQSTRPPSAHGQRALQFKLSNHSAAFAFGNKPGGANQPSKSVPEADKGGAGNEQPSAVTPTFGGSSEE